MKTDSQIIDSFGGNEAVAEICSPTLPAVVSGWRTRGIPRAWRAVLKIHSPQHFDVCEDAAT
jgi:hypothetical protein